MQVENTLDYQSIMTLAGSIITVGTAISIIQKVVKNWNKSREEHVAQILQAAKEEVSHAKVKLEARIKDVEADLETLKVSMSKDLDHVKETHNAELKNLGEKIEEVRSELRFQHTQILQLLTKMVDDRD